MNKPEMPPHVSQKLVALVAKWTDADKEAEELALDVVEFSTEFARSIFEAMVERDLAVRIQ